MPSKTRLRIACKLTALNMVYKKINSNNLPQEYREERLLKMVQMMMTQMFLTKLEKK